MIHSSINICNEIEYLTKKYETLMESDSYYALNKNKDVIATLNVNFRPLKVIFNKYAIKREVTEPTEMSAEKFFKLVTDISDMCKYNIVKLSGGDTKTDYNIDIFDFFRKIVGMAINLTEKTEDNEEDNNLVEKNDLNYIGLKIEEAVEKFIIDVTSKFKEKDMKDSKKK